MVAPESPVVRRPPPEATANTAHDVPRDHCVVDPVRATDVPVRSAVTAEDTNLMGRPCSVTADDAPAPEQGIAIIEGEQPP